MFTATIHFEQQRECILRRLTADADHPIPIEIEEVQDESVTFVLRAGENADTFQRELERANTSNMSIGSTSRTSSSRSRPVAPTRRSIATTAPFDDRTRSRAPTGSTTF